jgi:hypothetical protein
VSNEEEDSSSQESKEQIDYGDKEDLIEKQREEKQEPETGELIKEFKRQNINQVF